MLVLCLVMVVGDDATGAGLAIGGSIVFDGRGPRDQGWRLFVVNLDTRAVRKLVRVNGAVSPSWSPDGAEVAFEQASDIGDVRCDSPACAQIWRVDADGRHRRRLTSLHRRSEAPDWSSSGRIAFVRWLESPEVIIETDIYTIESNGHGLRRLTDVKGEDADPAWSPDGQQIAFSSDRDGDNSDLYVMNADGSDQHKLTDTPGASEYGPSWSPDGTRIAFGRFVNEENVYSIVVINAAGTGERRLTVPRETDADPVWSPDGEWIAFTRETDNLDSPEIWVMRANGREKRRLVTGPVGEVLELDWTATSVP